MAKQTIKATVSDVDHASEKFRRASLVIRRELHESVKDVAEDSELIYGAFALKDTGRMSRGVKAKVAGSGAVVTVHARDPESGFDYVAVTRFGHNTAKIVPKHSAKSGRYLAPIPGVGPRWVQKKAALMTPFGPRASVRGFHPSGDWADKAWPQVKANADARMNRAGAAIAAALA